MPLLLDTHTLIWLDEGSDRLGAAARKRITDEFQDGLVYVSPISIWEVGVAARKGRVHLTSHLKPWAQSLFAGGYIEMPLKTSHSILASDLEWAHQDPADRFLVATALVENLTLVTADKAIHAWRGRLDRLDARR